MKKSFSGYFTFLLLFLLCNCSYSLSSGLQIDNTSCYRIFVTAGADSAYSSLQVTPGFIAIASFSSITIPPIPSANYAWQTVRLCIDPFTIIFPFIINGNDATATGSLPNCFGLPVNANVIVS